MVEGNGDFLGNESERFGVTWNRIKNDGTMDIPWANPGGDFSATVLSSASVTSDASVFYTFGSSAAFVAAAQDAVANSKPLQLILYAPTTETGPDRFVRWDSDDASSASFHPLLTVSFVPEPSITALLGLSGLLLLRARRL